MGHWAKKILQAAASTGGLEMNLEVVNHGGQITTEGDLSEVIKPSDYKSLALSDLAQKIEGHHEQAKTFAGHVAAAARMSLEAALNAGRALLAAKAKVDHGEWTKWVQEHVHSLSSDQASRYMQLARQFPHVRNSDKLRTVREAYLACGVIKEPAKKATHVAVARVKKAPALSPSDFVSRFQSMRGFFEHALPGLEAEKMPLEEREDLETQIKGIIAILTASLQKLKQSPSPTSKEWGS